MAAPLKLSIFPPHPSSSPSHKEEAGGTDKTAFCTPLVIPNRIGLSLKTDKAALGSTVLPSTFTNALRLVRIKAVAEGTLIFHDGESTKSLSHSLSSEDFSPFSREYTESDSNSPEEQAKIAALLQRITPELTADSPLPKSPILLNLEDTPYNAIIDNERTIVYSRTPFVVGGEKTVHYAVRIHESGEKIATVILRSKDIDDGRITTSPKIKMEILRAKQLQATDDPRKQHVIHACENEYLEGPHIIVDTQKYSGDLFKIINGEMGPVEVKTIITYLQQACTGLSYIHDQGLFHGDVHLANFLIAEGVCKVGDLSTSRKYDKPFPEGLVLHKEELAGYSSSDDKRPYDVFCLGKEFEQILKQLRSSTEELVFGKALEALIPLMTHKDPEERISIREVERMLSSYGC